MYRPSPNRNPRSKGIKTKNVLQVCLLLAVCFWLIFQVKRSHDKKKEFDNRTKDLDKSNISLNTNRPSKDETFKLGSKDETFKLGRKDLQPKLGKDGELHEENEEQDDEQQDEEKVDEEKVDEEKIDEEKEDGGGGGDDEIDENEQEKSDVEVDKDEPEVIDEESQTEVDHEENGASVHTHEGREENYKADDASSAVVTHLNPENGTLEEISKGQSQTVNNGSSLTNAHENGPPSNTIINTSVNVTGEQIASNQNEGSSNESNSYNDESEGVDEGEKLEGREEILDPEEVENETHLEEKEVRMDLDTLPEIETEGGNSEEDSAVERR